MTQVSLPFPQFETVQSLQREVTRVASLLDGMRNRFNSSIHTPPRLTADFLRTSDCEAEAFCVFASQAERNAKSSFARCFLLRSKNSTPWNVCRHVQPGTRESTVV
jgi:hypothetical protein